MRPLTRARAAEDRKPTDNRLRSLNFCHSSVPLLQLGKLKSLCLQTIDFMSSFFFDRPLYWSKGTPDEEPARNRPSFSNFVEKGLSPRLLAPKLARRTDPLGFFHWLKSIPRRVLIQRSLE